LKFLVITATEKLYFYRNFSPIKLKGEGKIDPVLNQAPCHEDILCLIK